MGERQIASGTDAPQCGNYDDKTRAALGCGAPRMTPKLCMFTVFLKTVEYGC